MRIEADFFKASGRYHSTMIYEIETTVNPKDLGKAIEVIHNLQRGSIMHSHLYAVLRPTIGSPHLLPPMRADQNEAGEKE